MSWAKKKWKKVKNSFKINKHSFGTDLRHSIENGVKLANFFDQPVVAVTGRYYFKTKQKLKNMKKESEKQQYLYEEEKKKYEAQKLEQRKNQIDKIRERTTSGGSGMQRQRKLEREYLG